MDGPERIRDVLEAARNRYRGFYGAAKAAEQYAKYILERVTATCACLKHRKLFLLQRCGRGSFVSSVIDIVRDEWSIGVDEHRAFVNASKFHDMFGWN